MKTQKMSLDQLWSVMMYKKFFSDMVAEETNREAAHEVAMQTVETAIIKIYSDEYAIVNTEYGSFEYHARKFNIVGVEEIPDDVDLKLIK
jgi:hypothetical protein